MSRHGLQGFDGSEPEFALGSVRGVRWWNLNINVTPMALSGVVGPWDMGENTAACRNSLGHVVPDEDCACGFWAYWTKEAAPNPHGFNLPILGVIEGYGRTLIGERGFRCAKARLVALHFDDGTRHLIRQILNPAEHLAPIKFRAEGAFRTWEALTGRKIAPPPEPDPDEVSVRLSTLEFELEERYGVPVYSTTGYMLLKHPPTSGY